MKTPQTAIVVEQLKKSFGKLRVLEGINLTVERGRILALLGPNGAGKTTMVRILSTLLRPDSGKVTVGGYDVVNEAHHVRSIIGLTGQYAAVDEYLTGQENLVMMGRLYRLTKAASQRRARELLQQFDLVEAANRIAKTYSGGMRRRLDLALSLIATPPILFLDEPTTGLDPRSRLGMWQVIQALKANGTTMLLTTQYLEEADRLADQIAVIDHGRLIAEGTATELKARVGQERLELVIEPESNLATAVKVFGADPTAQVNQAERSLSISTDGTVADIKRVLNAMEQAQIEIETLSLHKPTLDDVFLHVTGHEATHADETHGDASPHPSL